MKKEAPIKLSQVTIVDPGGPHHGTCTDVYLSQDQILRIGGEKAAAETVAASHLHLSPGWMDLRVNFRDPGGEDKEDLSTGCQAALSAGFTAVGLSPELQPVTDHKAQVEYLLHQNEKTPLQLFPFASLSQGLQGTDLSEMYDLHRAGAVGFSHGTQAVENSALLRLALLYAREFAPPLHLTAYDATLRGSGQMHEGPMSTWLGMNGLPVLSETVGLLRNLHLAEYAETGIHCQRISSTAELDILRQARQQQEGITADVNLANLLLSDEDLHAYNPDLKLLPPLRSSPDREALRQAVKEGLLAVITSDHQPHREEDKFCEFERAAWGAAGMETFFGALWAGLQESFTLAELIPLFSHNPRRLLGLPVPHIDEGAQADLTLFDPRQEWQLSAAEAQSRAANNPWLNQPLRGRAVGVVSKGTILLWKDRLR